jgi:hypothetical protein
MCSSKLQILMTHDTSRPNFLSLFSYKHRQHTALNCQLPAEPPAPKYLHTDSAASTSRVHFTHVTKAGSWGPAAGRCAPTPGAPRDRPVPRWFTPASPQAAQEQRQPDTPTAMRAYLPVSQPAAFHSHNYIIVVHEVAPDQVLFPVLFWLPPANYHTSIAPYSSITTGQEVCDSPDRATHSRSGRIISGDEVGCLHSRSGRGNEHKRHSPCRKSH